MKKLGALTDRELYDYCCNQAQKKGQVGSGTLFEIRKRIHTDTPRGYKLFSTLIRGVSVPRHVKNWVQGLYNSKYKRLANEAFRGSIKTTAMTETFFAYQIAIHPERSNLLVQASDDTAEEACSNVGDIIENNGMWKLLFPNIVPDKVKGWGKENGRWVKRTDISYGEWTRIRHKNPTMLGGTYSASRVVGKHPTGVFVMDDINDDKNTESERRNLEVNRIVRETLFPMLESSAYNIMNQTPWTKRDALQLVKDTGVWDYVSTPVLTVNDPGVGRHVVVEKDGIILYDVWADLTWPEKFDEEMIALKYLESGEKGFARMYLCNVDAIEGINLRREWLHDYDGHVHSTWPIYFGLDYATSSDLYKGRDQDYFSITIVAKMPSGNRILVDGFRGRLKRGQAEQKTKALAAVYPTLVGVGVETDGVGKVFYDNLVRMSELPLIPIGTRRKKPGYRYEDVMAPQFEFGRVLLMENKTPFLRVFTDEWVSFPDGAHDDTLASTFCALAASGMFYEEAQPSPFREIQPWYEPQKRKSSPFAAWGKQIRGK